MPPLESRLDRLLAKAGIDQYKRELWFQGCELQGSILFAPDSESLGSIERMFAPRIREVWPALKIQIGVTKPRAASGLKKAWHGEDRDPHKQSRFL